MGNFLVRYASIVVIYDNRAVIRLATGFCYIHTVPKILIVLFHRENEINF